MLVTFHHSVKGITFTCISVIVSQHEVKINVLCILLSASSSFTSVSNRQHNFQNWFHTLWHKTYDSLRSKACQNAHTPEVNFLSLNIYPVYIYL